MVIVFVCTRALLWNESVVLVIVLVRSSGVRRDDSISDSVGDSISDSISDSARALLWRAALGCGTGGLESLGATRLSKDPARGGHGKGRGRAGQETRVSLLVAYGSCAAAHGDRIGGALGPGRTLAHVAGSRVELGSAEAL